MIVASHGIISVLRNTKKSSERKRNVRNENAYAARLAVSNCPMTTALETTKLFNRYRPIGIVLSTVMKLANVGRTGRTGGGNVTMSDSVMNEYDRASRSGNATRIATSASATYEATRPGRTARRRAGNLVVTGNALCARRPGTGSGSTSARGRTR